MNLRGNLGPFPAGWYALCFASELDASPRGSAMAFTWMGSTVHLRRDPDGTPIAQRLDGTPLVLRQVHQAILGWHHPTHPQPLWEVQAPPTKGWPKYLEHVFPPLHSHPQETSENAVDVAHFHVIHGYSDIETVEPATTDGPVLRASYRFRRPLFPGAPARLSNHSQMSIAVFGLGFSLVETTELNLGIETRQLVLATPTSAGQLTLRIGATVKPPSDAVWGRSIASAGRAFMMRALKNDVSDDFEIWQNKRYVERPIVVAGDGPLHLYRRWAKQFYPSSKRPDQHAPTMLGA